MHALYANINVTARLIYMKILTVSEYHHLHTLKLNPKLGLVFLSFFFFSQSFGQMEVQIYSKITIRDTFAVGLFKFFRNLMLVNSLFENSVVSNFSHA